MPGTDFQCTFKFKEQGGQGWSETIYIKAAGLNPRALDMATRLAVARRAILSKGYFLSEVVVSDVEVFRDSEILDPETGLGQPLGEGLFGANAQAGEQPWDRLLLRMNAGATARRGLELGGVPKNQITSEGRYEPTQAWQRLLQAYLLRVRNGTADIGPSRFTIRRQDTGNKKADLITVSSDPQNDVALQVTLKQTEATDIGLVAGSLVRVSRVRDVVRANGIWQVAQVDVIGGVPPTVRVTMIVKGGNKIFGPYDVKTGRIRVITISYPEITRAIPERGVRRKTGGPFDRTHGKFPRPI